MAVAWVHPDEASRKTEAMLDATAEGVSVEVPALWLHEVANVLTILSRRRKIRDDELHAALALVGELPLTVDHDASTVAFTTLVDLARKHDLTVYDAAYLELAARRRLPLASKDARMRSAARRHGVDLWTPA